MEYCRTVNSSVKFTSPSPNLLNDSKTTTTKVDEKSPEIASVSGLDSNNKSKENCEIQLKVSNIFTVQVSFLLH